MKLSSRHLMDIHWCWRRSKMHPLIAVLLVTTTASAVARPPTYWTPSPHHNNDEPPTSLASSVMIEKLRPPQMEDVLPRYFALEERPRYLQSLRQQYDEQPDWLTREINRLSDDINYEENIEQDRFNPLFKRSEEVVEMAPLVAPTDIYEDQISQSVSLLTTPMPKTTTQSDIEIEFKKKKFPKKRSDVKTSFALTPMDKGYYDQKQGTAIEKVKTGPEKDEPVYKKPVGIIEGPRRIRQNPNLGKTRNLVADDLEEFKSLVENGNTPKVVEGVQGDGVNASSVTDPAQALYGVAMMAAIGTASAFGLLAFIFGWYTLSRRAKAAADVDYPAYGVTGPSLDPSGDRKLAQSAHMYHYQHQKQQILALESGADNSRSVSDPESEEENEEGDYTVYECPGFATTGDMIVKNPLFSDEPTPATPGKCELVKPQPKE